MESRIDHKNLEPKWQALRHDKFKSVPDKRKAYTILNPPPNVTGKLHYGHFLNSTYNDILARRKRQEGYNVCFAFGMDHAGLATQIKVEQYLKTKGITKEMLGREKFLEECNKWKEEYGSTILNQVKRLGLSCDWNRLSFTLSYEYSAHVIDTFVKLYQAGLIYKGNYMTNWCTTLQTAISDEECNVQDEEIRLYYINYKLDKSDEEIYLTVATTRPETLFGDVAVAYNPEDERYKQYKGMNVILPLLNKSIPLVEDDRIKIEFGTGLCKITPAHDKDDFVTGQKYNLSVLPVIDKSGHIANTGTKYDGMYVTKARKEVLQELESFKLLVETKKKISQVSRCSRSGTIIEPMVTTQWFIKMKPLSDLASELLNSGKVEFIPEKTKNIFNSWVANIRDWCISRQIVYSHQIPIWYCFNSHENCANSKPKKCQYCESCDLTQETDTLDTWASSYIYQFATFQEAERDYYYPIDVMVSGQDILFFWIMRMMMTSAFLHNKEPFKKVFFHGIIRDETNKKISKSAGNCIDPLVTIEQVGLDPMRFSLMMVAPKEGDIRISLKTFDIGKKFCTKLWNVARLFQTNGIFTSNLTNDFLVELESEDEKMLNDLDQLKSNIEDCYNKLDFQRLSTTLYTFTWDTFANGYLEFCKNKLNYLRKQLLLRVFTDLIKLLYPIIPHVTEELWEIMGNKDLYLEPI